MSGRGGGRNGSGGYHHAYHNNNNSSGGGGGHCDGGRPHQQSSSNRPFFLRPADDTVTDERLNLEGEATAVAYHNPYQAMSIQQQRSRLPITKHKNQICWLLEQYRTLVIVGETGSGKSTQIPQFLAGTGWAGDGRAVCITQPRRVAAITLATRVADEMGCSLGEDVGYCVRFGENFTERTKIKFVTDGILLRELLTDPLLTAYSVVIIDEAHERSVNTDLLCGFLRKVIEMRLDLRVVISSATIDAELFRDYFELNETDDLKKNTATILSVEGRMFPVQTFYTKVGVPDYVQTTVETALQIHNSEGPGDILAFLTGQDEVERACELLRQSVKSLRQDQDKLLVLPMYGGLPMREQFRAFDSAPYQTRKVVVATNVAETSVTIAGVVYVIDCGFVKMRVFNSELDMESLMVVPISRSAADQRAGRAGRVRPGKCFRLYPEAEYRKLSSQTLPEVQRGDLAPVVLRLQSLGIQNVLAFQYVSRPSSTAMISALHLLYALGAIDDAGALTRPVGQQMSDLPLAPMHAKALIASPEFECSQEIVTIIAMLQVKDVFVQPSERRHKAEVNKRSFAVEEGDHLTLLNVYSAFIENGRTQSWCNQHFLNHRGLTQAESIREQLVGQMKRTGLKLISCKGTIGETAKIRRALLSGFFSQVARYDHTGLYVTIKGEHSFKVYKGSVVMYRKEYPKWVVFTDVLQNSIRDLSEIEPGWLEHLASHYYDFGHSKEDGDDDEDEDMDSASAQEKHPSTSGKRNKNIAAGRLANIN